MIVCGAKRAKTRLGLPVGPFVLGDAAIGRLGSVMSLTIGVRERTAAMGVYERLGMRRVINADATLTRLGGSLMPSDVLDAMREAAGSFVDMYELQQVVGKRLADLTRNEAARVALSLIHI